MKETTLTSLLNLIQAENREYGHRQFSTEFSHDGFLWEVRICDGCDDYLGEDERIGLAIARACNLLAARWEDFARLESNPEVQNNLKETAARFHQVGRANLPIMRGVK